MHSIQQYGDLVSSMQKFEDLADFCRTSKIFILKIIKSSNFYYLLTTCSSLKIYLRNILYKVNFLQSSKFYILENKSLYGICLKYLDNLHYNSNFENTLKDLLQVLKLLNSIYFMHDILQLACFPKSLQSQHRFIH